MMMPRKKLIEIALPLAVINNAASAREESIRHGHPYSICERKGRADEARAYKGLVIVWPELEKLAASASAEPEAGQLGLGLGGTRPAGTSNRALRSRKKES